MQEMSFLLEKDVHIEHSRHISVGSEGHGLHFGLRAGQEIT